MKNRILTGTLFILSGILLAIGPFSLFKVCPTNEMIMKCYWSVRAEIAIGFILVVSGVGYLLTPLREARIAVSIPVLAVNAAGILIPAVLIGGCDNHRMSCQSLTFPVIYVITTFNIIYILGNLIYLNGFVKDKQEGQNKLDSTGN